MKRTLHYYIDGKPNPAYLERLDVVRELLQRSGTKCRAGRIGVAMGKVK